MQRTHSKPQAREKENSNQPYPLKDISQLQQVTVCK